MVTEAEQGQVLAAARPGPTEEVVCEKQVLQVNVQIGSQPLRVVRSGQENDPLEPGVELGSGKRLQLIGPFAARDL